MTTKAATRSATSSPPDGRHTGAGPLLVLVILVGASLAGCIGSTSPTPSNDSVDPSDGGGTGNASDPAFDPGWPTLSEATLRPGIWAEGCTMNFVFRSPDNRSLYFGLAAHCVTDVEIGESVELAQGEGSGRLVYSSWKTSGDDPWQGENVHNDFALLRVDDADRPLVHPAVEHFGGPAGIASPPEQGDRVWTYGNTSFRSVVPGGDTLDPREGVVQASRNESTAAYFAPPSIRGDSGSPAMTGDGKALGTMSTLNHVWTDRLPDAPPPGSNTVSNLGYALDYLHENTDLRVELVTWKVLQAGALPGPPTENL